MPLIEKNIAKRIERLRRNRLALTDDGLKYLTEKELARLLYMTENDYLQKLTGRIPFSVKSINIISKIYDTDINYILFGGVK